MLISIKLPTSLKEHGIIHKWNVTNMNDGWKQRQYRY